MTATDVPTAVLDGFFDPSSVAVVGASERSAWSRNIVGNLRAFSPDVRVHLVNPRRDQVHDQPAVASLRDLDGDVDLVYVMVGRDSVVDVLRDAADAGAHGAVVLTAGFGEVAGGGAAEDELATVAAETGLHVLGPNASGYINAARGIVPFGMRLPEAPLPGPAAFVLHSGGLIKPLLAAAHGWGVGYSHVLSTGNEASLDMATIVDGLVDDPDVGAIGLFLESVRDVGRFRDATAHAADAGVPIVALSVGASEVARQAAMAHTGALASDGAVTAAALRHHGVVQVHSLEELVVSTGLLATRGQVTYGRRLSVVSASGGACDIVADTAERHGLTLPAFQNTTSARLRELLPELAALHNPLDVTGFVADEPELPVRALETVDEDGGVDVVAFQAFVQPVDGASGGASSEALFERIADAVVGATTPTVLMDATASPLTQRAAHVLGRAGIIRLPGIELGIRAIAAAVTHDELRSKHHRARATAADIGPVPTPALASTGSWTEADALSLLAAAGCTVVEHETVSSPQQAVAAAERLGGRVAIKTLSADIQHKSDVGAVLLDVGRDEIAAAYEQVTAGVAQRVPGALVRGALVTAMHPIDLELLVGVTVDPVWGPVLMLGIGGVLVEVLEDTALRLLPVDRSDVASMLDELRASALLDGVRGRPPVDRAAVVDAVLAVARAAQALGPRLAALEVNPLAVSADGAIALDALVMTDTTAAQETA